MKTWQNGFLYEEFDPGDGFGGGGGGGEVDDYIDDNPDLGGSDDSPDNGDDSPNPKGFDYTALAAANAATLGPILESLRPQQQQPQLSQEELNKMLARFDPDDEIVEALFGDNATKESRAAALKRMVDGIYGHVYKSTGMFVNEQLGGIKKEFEPLKAERAKQQYEGFKSGLVKAAPWIKDYSKLHDHAIQAVASSGQQFRSDKEAQNAIIGYIESLVKQVNPGFVKPQGNFQSRNSMPRIAGGAGSGRSGGGNGSSGAAGRHTWQTVLGPRKS